MTSTYVNDLRLNEMATGDASGSWGTVTNTNLELIAEAFSFGTEGITTNADTHTTTIADGATDPGRSMFLKYTGTLDSACTITIAPNTVSKLWFIENGTSGSQNIIIKQGSGATITIPPGDTKAIYSDGAGSGAAMVDAFASLNVVDLKVQDDLTVTDDVAIGGLATVGGTLDVTGNLSAANATFSSSEPLITGIDTGLSSRIFTIGGNNGNCIIDVDPNGTAGGSLFQVDVDNGEVLKLTSAGAYVTGLLDVSTNAVIDGTALVTGVLTTTAATVFNGGFASNNVSTIIAADGAGDNAYALQIKNQESTDDRSYGVLIQAGSTAVDTPLNIATHDGGTSLFTMVGSGQAQFVDGTASLPAISNLGDLNTGMYFPSADSIGFSTGGVERAFLTATQLNVTGNAIFGGSAHTFAGSATVANNLTLTDGNLVVAAGHGIDFSAQTATSASGASTTAELLNHYETGTWTPQFSGAKPGGGDVTYGIQQGYYTRVGNLVEFNLVLAANGSTIETQGNGMVIVGLPFTNVNDSNRNFPAVTVWPQAGLNNTSFTQGYGALIGDNTSQILVYGFISSTSNNYAALLYNQLATADAANNVMIRMTGTYRTSV